MKKFLLPAVISLALSSSYVLADGTTQETVAPIAPAVIPAQTINSEMERYQAAIEKRIAEQQAAMEKRMADQKAIIEKKIEQQKKQYHEMMEKRNTKMKEMQKLMNQSRNPKGHEDYQKMMDKMQEMHEKMRKENTPPAWANRTPPPANWNAPYAQQRAYRPPNSNVPMSRRGSNHADVGKSLKNIEELLQEVIIILQKK